MDSVEFLRQRSLYRPGQEGDEREWKRQMNEAADEIERLRSYTKRLEAALSHATECCSAFQCGGQFAHMSRLGEPIFDAVPRLVAKLSN